MGTLICILRRKWKWCFANPLPCFLNLLAANIQKNKRENAASVKPVFMFGLCTTCSTKIKKWLKILHQTALRWVITCKLIASTGSRLKSFHHTCISNKYGFSKNQTKGLFEEFYLGCMHLRFYSTGCAPSRQTSHEVLWLGCTGLLWATHL